MLTPQWIYLSCLFGLNWRWWRAPPLPCWRHCHSESQPSRLCHVHSQGGHSVFVFTLALVTAEPTHPPKTRCDSLCVTLEPYMAEGGGGSGLRQGSSVVHCLSLWTLCVCVCVSCVCLFTFLDELWSESHFDDLSSFFLPLHGPLSLSCSTDDLPIGRLMTSERMTKLHEDTCKAQRSKKWLHWRTRETTRWDTSTPPQRHSQRTPTTLVPLWSFTSSFLLQNMEKRQKKSSWDNWHQINTGGTLFFFGSRIINACYCK